MYSESDVSSIPTSGTNLVIVANVKDVLYFRIFDADGKVVVDTDETRLTRQAGPIADLKRQLDSVRPPHELTRSEKNRVVTAVTSIVGHSKTWVELSHDRLITPVLNNNKDWLENWLEKHPDSRDTMRMKRMVAQNSMAKAAGGSAHGRHNTMRTTALFGG